ncbi:kinase-like domain-containing protein [Mycena floridula]|nr:kinase-like domain-containing protein [Mycena floridula]
MQMAPLLSTWGNPYYDAYQQLQGKILLKAPRCSLPQDLATVNEKIDVLWAQHQVLSDHPNIDLIQTVLPPENSLRPATIMRRYWSGSNVEDLLAKLSCQDKYRIIVELAKALAHLHDYSVVHGNINMNNIIIDDKTGSTRLTDIGVYRTLKMSWQESPTVPGAFCYRSPEELQGQEPNFKTDVYAFGSTVYHISTGREHTCKSKKAQLAIVKAGHMVLPMPSSMDSKLREVVQRCWRRDPEERPDMDEVVAILLRKVGV